MNRKRILAVLALAVLVLPALRAQEKPAQPPPPPAGTVIPIKIQVLFSEFDGEKKVGSLPYVLNHNATTGRETRTSLRMGIRVPISTPSVNPAQHQIQYQNVGTDIDCFVRAHPDGAYQTTLELRRSSIYTPGTDKQIEWRPNEPAVPGTPFFREFSGRVDALLKDGQTIQTTVATDPVSGRTLRVDVTLSVIK